MIIMNGLRKIQYNCAKATFLIEKKLAGKITLRERLVLKIHLAGCSVCRLFQQQSVAINKMIKELFRASKQKDVSLDEAFKKDLQERIEEELKKS
jgi:predicted anti-sigma-YlaC factor YlaD